MRCWCLFQRAIYADAAPAIGVIRTGEEQTRINVIEKAPALRELAFAQGTPGLPGPFIGHPVVPGGIYHLQVIAPLVDHFLGVFDGVEVVLLQTGIPDN